MNDFNLSHLDVLEAESIYILREVAAEFARPALLYSIGKDSSVMLRIAHKAFYPGKIPFRLLHIDTTYKFREMIEFRDRTCRELNLELIVYTNHQAVTNGVSPFRLGTARCCALLKTQALGCAACIFNRCGNWRCREKRKNREPKSVCFLSVILQGSGTRKISVLSCGISITEGLRWARIFGCSLFPIGLNWMSGSISTENKFQLSRCTLRKNVK
jgi:hypothetical protein